MSRVGLTQILNLQMPSLILAVWRGCLQAVLLQQGCLE